jgi:hypothetical protein
MAEYSAVATLTSSAGAITFNNPASSVGFHDPDVCSGLDKYGPARSVTEDRPRTAGGIVYPRLAGPRIIVLGGWVDASSLSAREAFLNSLSDVVHGCASGGGTYVWAAVDGTKTLSDLWLDMEVTSIGKWAKRYLFSLVAPSPSIS